MSKSHAFKDKYLFRIAFGALFVLVAAAAAVLVVRSLSLWKKYLTAVEDKNIRAAAYICERLGLSDAELNLLADKHTAESAKAPIRERFESLAESCGLGGSVYEYFLMTEAKGGGGTMFVVAGKGGYPPDAGPVPADRTERDLYVSRTSGSSFTYGNRVMTCYYPLYTISGRYAGLVGIRESLSDFSGGLQSAILAGGFMLLTSMVMAAALLWSTSAATAIKKLQADLQARAERDSLTGLYNRSKYESFNNALKSGRLPDITECSLLVIDHDDLKTINDTFGHAEGDQALKMLAQAIRESIRQPNDIPVRSGGDEFTVILPMVNLRAAARVAARIIARYKALTQESGLMRGISIGVGGSSNRRELQQHGLDGIYRDADKALYDSKNSGKSRMTVCGDSA